MTRIIWRLPAQHLQAMTQFFVHRRFDTHRFAGGRMLEAQRRGVQEQTLQAGTRQLTIELAVAVAIVKGDRMPGMQGVHADLVGTPGDWAGLHQGGEFVTLLHLEAGFRRLAFAVDAHDTFTALQNVFQQRRLYGLAVDCHWPRTSAR